MVFDVDRLLATSLQVLESAGYVVGVPWDVEAWQERVAEAAAEAGMPVCTGVTPEGAWWAARTDLTAAQQRSLGVPWIKVGVDAATLLSTWPHVADPGQSPQPGHRRWAHPAAGRSTSRPAAASAGRLQLVR